MKFSALVLLPVVAEAGLLWPRNLLWPRQMGGLKVASSKKVAPEIKDNAVHIIQQLGPLTLKGRGTGQDSGQQNFMFSIPREAFCRDCTVLRGHIGLSNLDGTKINPSKEKGVYIHHILTFDTTKRSAPFLSSCVGGGALTMLGSKFVGSGEDNNNVPVWYTTKDGSHSGGFHIGSSDSFAMNADLVSLNAGSSQVYLTMDMEYLPGKVGHDTQETLLSVETCGGQRLRTSATGPTNSTSGKYTFKQNGSIIVAKGHLHAGGDRVQVYINNKLTCESKAQYGGSKGEMAINEMSICPEIKVKNGDVMTFSVVYDVSKHPVRHESKGMGAGMPDIMGMLDVVFSPTQG